MLSWMYGELDAGEREKVEAYLSANPDELKKIQQLQEVRSVMSNIAEKEVIAPPLMHDDQPPVIPIWRTSYFRISMTIAASFILIIVAGRLLRTEISYANNELRISFGSPKPTVPVEPSTDRLQATAIDSENLTSAQVQSMIDASLKSSEIKVGEKLVSVQQQLDKSIRSALASAPSSGMDSLANRLSRASEQQVRAFVTGLREENLQMMRQYLQLSAGEQRAYMENLLVDFSKWQQEQRNQDLQILLTRVNSIENNTNQLKQETEQILSSIISSTGIRQQQSN